MITGRKPAALVPAGDAIGSSRTALALAVQAAPEAMIALY